jgi:hypothetical protein
MRVNRISRLRWDESTSEPAAVVAPPIAAPQNFVVSQCLFAGGGGIAGWTWQNEVFRIAYENARANQEAASRSIYANRLFSIWN